MKTIKQVKVTLKPTALSDNMVTLRIDVKIRGEEPLFAMQQIRADVIGVGLLEPIMQEAALHLKRHLERTEGK